MFYIFYVSESIHNFQKSITFSSYTIVFTHYSAFMQIFHNAPLRGIKNGFLIKNGSKRDPKDQILSFDSDLPSGSRNPLIFRRGQLVTSKVYTPV